MEEVEKEIILDELRRTLEGENRRLSENYAAVCLESVLQNKRIVDLEEALRGIASTANANKYTHEAALLCALSSIEDMALDALSPAKSEDTSEEIDGEPKPPPVHDGDRSKGEFGIFYEDGTRAFPVSDGGNWVIDRDEARGSRPEWRGLNSRLAELDEGGNA